MNEIRQISQIRNITGMVTLRNRLFFFDKDGMYMIEMPEPEPWYRRAWVKLVNLTKKRIFGRL